ncbi:MAG: hypothetical protein ACOCQA_04025 [bacterium]
MEHFIAIIGEDDCWSEILTTYAKNKQEAIKIIEKKRRKKSDNKYLVDYKIKKIFSVPELLEMSAGKVDGD